MLDPVPDHAKRPGGAAPGASRAHRLRNLAPWLVTAAIFAAIFAVVPFAAVIEALRQARLAPYLALIVGYASFYFLVDSFALHQVINWFNCPVRYRDILPVRATTYLLSLLNTNLGQGGLAAYLHRRHGVPFWEVTGSVLFLAMVEVYQLALYSLAGAVATGLVRGSLGVAYAVLLVYLPAHMWYFARRRREGTGGGPRLLVAFRRARPRHYLLLLAYKSPNFIAALGVHYLAVGFFGMHIPLTRLLTFLPLVFFLAALPITVAHLGTSQAAWIYFFGDVAPRGTLLAYSLASHFLFMLVNGSFGLLFLRRAARELWGDQRPARGEPAT